MRRVRRPIVLLLAGVAAAAAPAAQAGWSPVARVAGSARAGTPAVATDARGDVAVGWFRLGHQRATTALRVAVRRGPQGRFATHTLLHGTGIALTGLALALDERGELTVAWVQRGALGGLELQGPTGIRAAFRTAGGRWSVARRVSTISPFTSALPHLVARPDRHVLLTFNAGIPSAPGVGYAWRRPGRIFGRVRSLQTGSRPRGYFLGGFDTGVDAAGRVYVAGVRRCDSGAGVAEVHVARRGHARLGPRRVLARGAARDLRLVVQPSDGATAAWLTAGCSTTELLPGAVRSSRVTAGGRSAAPPVTVAPAPATQLSLSGGASGTAELAWTTFGPTAPDGVVQIARMDAGGAWTAPLGPPDGWVSLAADAGGDQLVADLPPANLGFPSRVAVRTPDGAVTPSPLRPRFVTTAATALPAGRGIAAATATARGVRVTSWRP
ncbi:MAG TPA: hypothetical protein VFT50_18620 [Baekduia sp.]|nr:hypothetical protein [Baekduia sp.]